MPIVLSKATIERIAPDQASLGAALKLLKPATWPLLAQNDAASLLWGECQGSGASPYRVSVSADDLGYKCTCPSRKFPCKHVLAVLWLHCDKPAQFQEAAPPDWVQEWLSRRRARPGGTADADASAISISAALRDAAPEAEADPKAAARAEAQRHRLREEREASVLAGLDELDLWMEDQLDLGLAGFAQRATRSARTLSTRLVDAKAPGLARRLDLLVAEIYRVPDLRRGDLAVERLAALALITAAYRRQDVLPPALKADVRRAAGWTARREELLADDQAPRIAGDWLVAATRSEVQPDRLRRLETWLLGAASATIALLVDFVPVSGGPAAPPFIPGEIIAGEIVFYPSATPLRGLLATRGQAQSGFAWPALPDGLAAALIAYETALTGQPWLEFSPLGASGLRIERLPDRQLGLTDAAGRVLPIDRTQTDALTPLLGLGPVSALFVWDGWFATVLAADTPIGRWHEA